MSAELSQDKITGRTGELISFPLSCGPSPLIGTGIIISIKPTSNNAAGLLIAFYCTQFFLAQGNMVISLISRNIAGQTKKSTCLTMTFVGKSQLTMMPSCISCRKEKTCNL